MTWRGTYAGPPPGGGSVDGAESARSHDFSDVSSAVHQRTGHALVRATSSPIEEYIAKYQVVKSSWRGKYERIFALAPARFSTIDPKDFEVTNTWSFTALSSITLDPSDEESFTLTLQGGKKDKELKLRCRFRSRLVSDLYRLQSQYVTRRQQVDVKYPCSKWSRKDLVFSCQLEIGADCLTCTKPDGSLRSKYLFVDIEHLSPLPDAGNGFAVGYGGRSRIFFSDSHSQIVHKIQVAAKALGYRIPSRGSLTLAVVKGERKNVGVASGTAFVQFDVQKLTPKQKDPVDRILSIHQKHLVEFDTEGDVVSSYEYKQIYVLVRDLSSATHFEIQFINGQTRKYIAEDRDGVLAAIYDICVTCDENPELFLSCVPNERGLRLLPFFATESPSETTSFFGDSSIGSWFLQRMTALSKFGSIRNAGDKGFVEIVAEFNANVPASGIHYNTKQSLVADALRPIGAQLHFISKAAPIPSRSAVTLLQALVRIAPSHYGFREIMSATQIVDSLTNLLVHGDEFVVFWTTLLLRKLTAHSIPSSVNSDASALKSCEEAEASNKRMLCNSTYLIQSLLGQLDGLDIEQHGNPNESLLKRRVGPLVVMGVLQTLEGYLCSRKATTAVNDFQVLVAVVAKYYSILLKTLFQSRCATTVEACTLLLKTILEECEPDIAMNIRNAALTEGIVLRHFYQSVFHDSYDLRCVSRYLTSLWMSNHQPSHKVLAQIIPSGFFAYLTEPLQSAKELEELDQVEQAGFNNDRDDRPYFGNGDGMAFMTDPLFPEAKSDSSDNLDFQLSALSSSRDSGQPTELLTRRSASGSVLNDRSAVSRADERRLSGTGSSSSSSISNSGSRTSMTWVSNTVRESFTMQIENEHAKARMRQKLEDSAAAPKKDSAKSKPARSRSAANRTRKRDIAFDFIVNAVSKSKADETEARRLSQTKSKRRLGNKGDNKQENFLLMFYMLRLDHSKIDLIWNNSMREQLKESLESEINRFSNYQKNQGHGRAYWNYEDFRIDYSGLTSEIQVGGYYLKILCDLPKQLLARGRIPDARNSEDGFVVLPSDNVLIPDPPRLIASLYRRILRENIRAEFHNDLETTLLCLNSLAIVAAACAHRDVVAEFEEMEYLVVLIENTKHVQILEGILQVIRSLCIFRPNARILSLKESCMNTIVQLLQMIHVTDRDLMTSKAVWIVERENAITLGALSVNGIKQKRDRNSLQTQEAFVVRAADDTCEKTDARIPLMNHAQLRWETGIEGAMHPVQVAHDAVSILLAVAHSNCLMRKATRNLVNDGTKSETGQESIIGSMFPTPRSKSFLLKYTQILVPVLVRFRYPELCQKVGQLMQFLFADLGVELDPTPEEIEIRSALHSWGLFYMAFLVDTPDFEPFAAVLKSTHQLQRGFGGSTVLKDILPEATVNFLSVLSPTAFSQIFCDGIESPEIVWNRNMRLHLRDNCLAHLQDYVEYLQEDVTSKWKFCPMAPVSYVELEEEFWCGGLYLGKFCERPDYIVRDPLSFMKDLTRSWRAEVSRQTCTLSFAQAAERLHLTSSMPSDANEIRTHFKNEARAVVLEALSPAEYAQRIASLKEAYWVLTCPRPTLLSSYYDPVNLLHVLNSLVLMCNRYPSELRTHEFDAYDLLLSLLDSLCTAKKAYPSDVKSQQLVEISVCAAELLHTTCASSIRNGEILLDQPDLDTLEKVVNYCVESIISKAVDTSSYLIQVCFYVLQTITGLLASRKGRLWMLHSKTLMVDMVRILWIWNHTQKKTYFLSKITQQVLEGVSRMSILQQNQDRILRFGIVWQLIVLFSDYEVELDDTTVHARLQITATSVEEDFGTIHTEVQNLLAIMSIRALCRLGGIFAVGSELATSPNEKLKVVLDALLTPNLAGLLILNSHHEFLKIFHGNCESYTLFWNEEMREELLDFVVPNGDLQPGTNIDEDYSDALSFRFNYLKYLFNVGGLYMETLMASLIVLQQSSIPASEHDLGLTETFFTDLFGFIDVGKLKPPRLVAASYVSMRPHSGWGIDESELSTVYRVNALNCLAVLCIVAPSLVESNIVRDIGAIKVVLRLLFPPDNEVHQSEDAKKNIALPEELYLPCREYCLSILLALSCMEQFGKAAGSFGVCDILIEVVHVSRDVGPEALSIIRNLCSCGASADFVSELLQSGAYVEFIGWLLLVEDLITDEEFIAAERLRFPCAQIFSAMTRPDAALNVESKHALCRFFPASLVHELSVNPETFLEYYMADHENPELVWNAKFRSYLQNSVIALLNEYYSVCGTESGRGAATVVSKFVVDYSTIYPYPMTGNVYLQIFLDNPTYMLRDPLYFATSLWEEFVLLFKELVRITSSIRETMSPDDDISIARYSELLELVTSCIVCVAQLYPWLVAEFAKMKIPEKCCHLLNDAVRYNSGEPCAVSLVRLLRLFSLSKTCIAAMRPGCPTAFSCLLALINPSRGGVLHFEAGYIMDIIRRLILQYDDHGERDASTGIVFVATRLDLFGYMLNLLDNPTALGAVKEPQRIRAAAIDILNMLEKDRGQASTAHQILKKHKKWTKQYKMESTQILMTATIEDPFLQKQYPNLEQQIRAHISANPPLRASVFSESAAVVGASREERVSMLQRYGDSPRNRVAMTQQGGQAFVLAPKNTKRVRFEHNRLFK